MKFECRDGVREADPTWIKDWNDTYLGVNEKLIQLQGYCKDDGKKRPTRRGLRRFLGSIIRRDCPMRNGVRERPLVEEEKPDVPLETRQDFLKKMKERIWSR